jgi:hypothetical protein
MKRRAESISDLGADWLARGLDVVSFAAFIHRLGFVGFEFRVRQYDSTF